MAYIFKDPNPPDADTRSDDGTAIATAGSSTSAPSTSAPSTSAPSTSAPSTAVPSPAAPARPALTLVVDNTARPIAPSSAPRAPVPAVRNGLPPEIARLMAVHGAPVHRALGLAPRPRAVAAERSDDWWWDWAEDGR